MWNMRYWPFIGALKYSPSKISAIGLVHSLAASLAISLALNALALPAQAEDGATIMRATRATSRPAMGFSAPKTSALPPLFRVESAPRGWQVMGYAPYSGGFSVMHRVPLTTSTIRSPLADSAASSRRAPAYFPSELRTHYGDSIYTPAPADGMPNAINYCVRLCDGFAFPIGNASGDDVMQEISCRRACPGAETALYSMPAGAQDFNAMSRGGVPYTALPTAFRYREKITNACTCRTPGDTQSVVAILTDMTLKSGDLVMTRAGARHFDGAQNFPYRPTEFSDALAHLTSKKEIAAVKAMEAASVRGTISQHASPRFKNRVILSLREAERMAQNQMIEPIKNTPRGFAQLQAPVMKRPIQLQVVRRVPGLVAMN